VQDAFKHPGPLNQPKIESQQARRILDRIVGYHLSPLLWKKIARGLSAGRVQSVAVKLICDREKEIASFKQEEYWTIDAELAKESASDGSFIAKLIKINDKPAEIGDEEHATKIIQDAGPQKYVVQAISEKIQRQRPLPPFITSTLQQAGANQLRWPIAKTMKIAQELYEGLDIGKEGTVGLITYMRTDSLNISAQAQSEALSFIKEHFGPAFAPAKPNRYRSRKGAQEAHEAIRPSLAAHTPPQLKSFLNRDQYMLYKMIWERFLASQMTPAKLNRRGVDIAAGPYLFRANDTDIVFPGYLKVIGGKKKKGEDEKKLPPLVQGETLTLRSLTPAQHFTKPPARYSEATLVKELEEKGIGRPSTYAPTIATIRKRGYVKKEQGRLNPTQLGEVVNDKLIEGFPKIINVKFTAHMEDKLDSIESGKANRAAVLKEFYEPFMKDLEKADETIKSIKKPPEPTSAICEKCGSPMVIRYTFKGDFLACSAFPRCRNIKRIDLKEDGSFSIEQPTVLDEKCPQCGQPLTERNGRYGKFVACTGYPKCRYIKPKTIGMQCPEPHCDGEIVERRRGKATFYGCSNYPKCRFTAKSIDELKNNDKAADKKDKGGHTD
jgi:DNA topoisomerase-1